MSGTMLRMLGVAGVLALMTGAASAAVVETLDSVQPVANAADTTEVAGPASVLKVQAPANLVADAGLTDGGGIVVFIEGLNSAGTAVTLVTQISGGNVTGTNGTTYDDGAGSQIVVNLAGQAGITTFFNTSGLTSVRVYVTTGANDPSVNSVRTFFSASDETGGIGIGDECFAKDSDTPGLSSVFLNSSTLYFVYAEALNNGDGNGTGLGAFTENGDNQTILSDVTTADFQFATTNSFNNGTGNPPTPFTVSASFTDTTGMTTIQADVTGNATIVNGTFLRSKADNDGVGQSDIRDVAGNRASQSNGTGDASASNPVTTGTVVSALPALTITRVDWVEKVDAGGTVAEALRVTYSLPLDDAGDLAFYGGASTALTVGTSPVDSDIDLDAANVSTSNQSQVLIDVTSNTMDAVAANGLLAASNGTTATGRFNITTVLAGSRPSSIFSSSATEYATAQTQTIGDAIAPSLVARAFQDLDGDGDQDAAAFVFDEPMGVPPTAGNFSLTVNNGQTVHPFHQITSLGVLTSDTTSGTPTITVVSSTRTNVDVNNNGQVTTDENNSGISLTYNPDGVDWDADSTTRPTDTSEAMPGTGDANAVIMAWAGTGTIEDANGNDFVGTLTAGPPTEDRAEAVVFRFDFLDGESMENDTTNNMLFSEQDPLTSETLGDQPDNDRLRMIFSEDLQTISDTNDLDESTIQFGTSGATFNDNDFLFNTPQNQVTLTFINPASQADASGFVPGVTVNVIPNLSVLGTNLQDANNVQISVANQATVDRTALYTANALDVNNQVTRGAVLVDADGDGFVDQIRIRMTRPVASSTVQAANFSINFGGTISAAAVDGSDSSVINLTVTDGVVSINNSVTLTYNGASDATPLASTTTGLGNGVAVAAVDDSIIIEKVATPNTNTRDVAIMPLVGTITTNGSTPAPFGTKVYAMIAVPTVNSVTATHNNIEFSIRRGSRYDGINERSFEAWTNWWLGIESDIYLLRDTNNFQFYENTKFDDGNNDGDIEGNSILDDTIRLTVNDRSITAVTFTGVGETTNDRVSAGRVGFCWDVLRSSDGTYDELYRNGYAIGGKPILSSAVVTASNGRYEMHVSAPISAFNGRTRFNAIGWPVILVVELPSGQRFVASSLATSVNRDPLLFVANNRTQGIPGDTDNAGNAVSFNVNLNNIGTQNAYKEWNTVAFPRASGFARATTNQPVLPTGVTGGTTGVIRFGTALPFVDPVDQFVFFADENGDKAWTISDDAESGSLDSVAVDADCFSNFYFTMTSFGVQLGTGVTNIVGGYGLGFYNNSGRDFGLFQFGTPLTATATFTSPAFFPNNTTTQGWALATISTAFATGSAFGTANARSDYIIVFDNMGSDGIDVKSLDIAAPSGTDNPNDLGAIDAGTAAFIHYTAN